MVITTPRQKLALNAIMALSWLRFEMSSLLLLLALVGASLPAAFLWDTPTFASSGALAFIALSILIFLGYMMVIPHHQTLGVGTETLVLAGLSSRWTGHRRMALEVARESQHLLSMETWNRVLWEKLIDRARGIDIAGDFPIVGRALIDLRQFPPAATGRIYSWPLMISLYWLGHLGSAMCIVVLPAWVMLDRNLKLPGDNMQVKFSIILGAIFLSLIKPGSIPVMQVWRHTGFRKGKGLYTFFLNSTIQRGIKSATLEELRELPMEAWETMLRTKDYELDAVIAAWRLGDPRLIPLLAGRASPAVGWWPFRKDVMTQLELKEQSSAVDAC